MSIIVSEYRAPLSMPTATLQTGLPHYYCERKPVYYEREKITTPDGDFLALDWVKNGHPKLAIISHGLEGNSSRWYVTHTVHALRHRGWDVLAWNMRGCSGELNRQPYFYHAGKTDDLAHLIDDVQSKHSYQNIVLIGFSLGGNLTLKWLGEQGTNILPAVQKAVVFSAPCDLASSAEAISRLSRAPYQHYFMRSLKVKVRAKALHHPLHFDLSNLDKMRSFREFDGAFVAPFFGFTSADDYWKKASAKPLLKHIAIPTLMVNAQNDPFLGKPCFPFEEAKDHPFFHLEAPKQGGHVGFPMLVRGQVQSWMHKRIVEFVEEI